ncbi:MAG: hypothetical protein CVU42_10935 [Chloroflexi bacterium HGW-Chloroflexi-4]|jgi:hypothetical protein|nr:MAG: hypothetical protein CVU42_10935 [Chloroflexi bacterium HGW-Chloroflexi-4]
MNFKVTFNESTQIVESRVHCDFDWTLVETMIPEIGKHIIENGSNLIFIDFRRSKVMMSTIKIYETPRKIAEEFGKMGINAQKLRRAILIKPGQKDFDFLESVTSNNAQILKLFYEEELAMQWLISLRPIKVNLNN